MTITNDEGNDESENVTGARNSVAAVVATLIGASTAWMVVSYGEGVIRAQFTSPIIGGEGIASVALSTTLGTIALAVSAALIAVFALGFLGGFATPRYHSLDEYDLVAIGGIAGAIITPIITTLQGDGGLETATAAAVVALGVAGAFSMVKRADASTSSTTPERPHQKAPSPGATDVDWERTAPDVEYPDTQTADGNAYNSSNEGRGDDGPESADNANDSATEREGDFEFNWTSKTDVCFEDVGGMDDLKAELSRDIIRPLTTGKEKADEFDIPLPNILFHGPPGTGKTFVAKALATELGLPFAKLSGGDIQSKWINESAEKINTLFNEAKRVSAMEGGAVVFIDELDSVLRDRSDGTNSHAEDQKVVNEFLNQLQDTSEHDILFIGATNRPDILDDAGTRSGRIDKKIEVGKPDVNARRAIAVAQLDERPHDIGDDKLDTLAERTDGMVAADIEGLIVDAARNSAFGRGDDEIRWTDIETVLEE